MVNCVIAAGHYSLPLVIVLSMPNSTFTILSLPLIIGCGEIIIFDVTQCYCSKTHFVRLIDMLLSTAMPMNFYRVSSMFTKNFILGSSARLTTPTCKKFEYDFNNLSSPTSPTPSRIQVSSPILTTSDPSGPSSATLGKRKAAAISDNDSEES